MINVHSKIQPQKSPAHLALSVNRFVVFGGFAVDDINLASTREKPSPFSCVNSNVQGNTCVVVAGSRAAITNVSRSDYARETACFSWPANELDDDTDYHIECINNGFAVQLCGHGILATANYWLAASDRKFVTLIMGGVRIDVVINELGLLAGHVLGQKSNQETDQPPPPQFLRASFAALKLASREPPVWLDQFDSSVRSMLIGSAESESHDGYLVLEFDQGCDLTRLPAFDQRAAKFTQRAVLYVSAASEPEVELGDDEYFPINLRYFAPQHGNAEDAATGSAARVAASYFYPRRSNLFVQQRSAQQGWLFTETNAERIAVMGACQRLCQDIAKTKHESKDDHL